MSRIQFRIRTIMIATAAVSGPALLLRPDTLEFGAFITLIGLGTLYGWSLDKRARQLLAGRSSSRERFGGRELKKA